ncbi:hypothetical protein D9M69_544710 [compost metagenome]
MRAECSKEFQLGKLDTSSAWAYPDVAQESWYHRETPLLNQRLAKRLDEAAGWPPAGMQELCGMHHSCESTSKAGSGFETPAVLEDASLLLQRSICWTHSSSPCRMTSIEWSTASILAMEADRKSSLI